MVEEHIYIEVAADQMMDDPVPKGRKTDEENHGKNTLGAGYPITTLHTRDPLDGKGSEMICIRTGEEEISIPEGGRELGAGYPITTPHTRAPLVGRGEMINKRTVKTTLAGKTAKPWWESVVGLVGLWRRVELELTREEKNTRRVEKREVKTSNHRKLKEQSKLNFLRKFYPECSTSGGKTLKLIHTNKKSKLNHDPH